MSGKSDSSRTTASPSPADGSGKPEEGQSRRRWLYLLAVVAILVVTIVAAYVLSGGFSRPGTSSTKVLIPAGTLDSLPVDQYDTVSFIITSNATVNGTFYNTYGIQVYAMTPAEAQSYARTGHISGYEWTSGAIANNTIYSLDVVLPAGAWYVVFVNTNPTQTCAIGFYTDLTLTPS